MACGLSSVNETMSLKTKTENSVLRPGPRLNNTGSYVDERADLPFTYLLV